MRLCNSQLSGNCWKVRQLLALRGIEYERVELDVIDRSNRREVLGGKNPALRVPTLELDDGEFLAESNAIIWYLADGTEWLPDEIAYEIEPKRTTKRPVEQPVQQAVEQETTAQQNPGNSIVESILGAISRARAAIQDFLR